MPEPESPIDKAAKAMLGGLDHPIFIVTTASTEELGGCLVGFGGQCNINPPRMMVWLSKENATYRVAKEAAMLAVHALSADQRDLAELFGEATGDEVDKFALCRWHPGPDGVPVLAGCARWLVGRIIDQVDAGDHVGFLLHPVDASVEESPNQLSSRQVRDLQPAHPVS